MFALALSAAIGGCLGVLWLARSHAHATPRRYQMHDWILHEQEERKQQLNALFLTPKPSAPNFDRSAWPYTKERQHVVKADFQRTGNGR